jgi:predicted ester cyclase
VASAPGAIAQSDDAKAVSRRAIELVCARGDFGAARELYSADFVDHVNSMEFRGQEGIRRSVGLYLTIFEDLRIEVAEQVAEGDRVTSRWTLRGKHRGRAVELDGITISRFVHGKITEDWTASDNLELLRQLGVRRSLALGLRRLLGRL